MLENVSIIIPIAPDETAQENLLDDLKTSGAEIIISSEGSRAKSLNVGAIKSNCEFLWFLHADSHVSADNLAALEKSLREKPATLHYFGLQFDGDSRMAFNAWGANIRSRLFGTPFGDQGFCLAKDQFEKVEGYPENLPYGEDLMFVWHARQVGIKLTHIPSKLLTSSRTYKTQGWLKLTLLYQRRWITMSLPEAWKLLMRRLQP